MKVVPEALMKASLLRLEVDVKSAGMPEFIDITENVENFVALSGVTSGFVVVFSQHTTAAVVIQENEPLLLKDMSDALDHFSPKAANYRHNDFKVRTVHMHEDECPNGHSHCQHLALGSSETIPISEGKLTLGKWQRIFVVELDDDASREFRQILIQSMGI